MPENREAFNLSDAGAHGASVLAALHARAFERPWGEVEFARLLSLQACRALVLSADETPIGFVLIQTVMESAEILTLAVTPAERRRGAGRRLVAAAERAARAAGARRMMLEVSTANAPARALYAACDYAQAAITRTGRMRSFWPNRFDRRQGAARPVKLDTAHARSLSRMQPLGRTAALGDTHA